MSIDRGEGGGRRDMAHAWIHSDDRREPYRTAPARAADTISGADGGTPVLSRS